MFNLSGMVRKVGRGAKYDSPTLVLARASEAAVKDQKSCTVYQIPEFNAGQSHHCQVFLQDGSFGLIPRIDLPHQYTGERNQLSVPDYLGQYKSLIRAASGNNQSDAHQISTSGWGEYLNLSRGESFSVSLIRQNLGDVIQDEEARSFMEDFFSVGDLTKLGVDSWEDAPIYTSNLRSEGIA